MESTRGWSTERALLLMALCSQAYAQYKRPPGPIMLPQPYRMIDSIAGQAYAGVESPLGFLIVSDTETILAFRGTIHTDEWVSDAIARQAAYPFAPGFGRTHAGMTDVYASMRSRISGALSGIPQDRPLYLTGHSLGGALAVLAAADLAADGRRPVVYTFGAPRTGDPRFACRYAQLVPESYRIANPHDLVTRLPPPVYWSVRTNAYYFYRHVKSRIRIAFRLAGLSANHSLLGYFRSLARQNPVFAASVEGSLAADDG